MGFKSRTSLDAQIRLMRNLPRKEKDRIQLLKARIYEEGRKGLDRTITEAKNSLREFSFLLDNIPQHVSYRSAARWTRENNIQNQSDYRARRPPELPERPWVVYKKDWRSWGEFFGNNYLSMLEKRLQYGTFEEARCYVRKLGFSSCEELRLWSSSEKRPDSIPSHPDRAYKDEGWTSWSDYIGSDRISSKLRSYRSFRDARKFARALVFANSSEFRKFARRPSDIPSCPDNVYKDKGWTSWGDFLGSGYVANRKRKFLPYEDARRYMRTLGLPNTVEYRSWYATEGKGSRLPSWPPDIYANKGWTSWEDFLGSD